MTTLCVSVQRLREFNVYLCKKSLRKPKMIILFMDVYKVQSGFYWSVAGICNFGGFVSFLAGLFGFILAGTDIRSGLLVDKNSIQMDNFVPQTDRHTDTQTDRHTHLLYIY